jgi:flagellar hook assembly protein FlgD
MSSLVGRTCSASVGDVNIQNPAQIPPIDVEATSGSPKGSSIVVTDANGKEIRRIAVPDNGGTVQWDGRDSSGNLVAPGAYHVAVDNGTSTADITANWHDKIDSVELSASGSLLQMGGITFAPSTITSIGAASTTTTDSITSAINAATVIPQGT